MESTFLLPRVEGVLPNHALNGKQSFFGPDCSCGLRQNDLHRHTSPILQFAVWRTEKDSPKFTWEHDTIMFFFLKNSSKKWVNLCSGFDRSLAFLRLRFVGNVRKKRSRILRKTHREKNGKQCMRNWATCIFLKKMHFAKCILLPSS